MHLPAFFQDGQDGQDGQGGQDGQDGETARRRGGKLCHPEQAARAKGPM